MEEFVRRMIRAAAGTAEIAQRERVRHLFFDTSDRNTEWSCRRAVCMAIGPLNFPKTNFPRTNSPRIEADTLRVACAWLLDANIVSELMRPTAGVPPSSRSSESDRP